MVKPPQIQTEHHTIYLFKQGDHNALTELYDKYAPAIFGILVRITNHTIIAENCLLTSFKEIWKQRQSYDPTKESLFTWMVKIAKATTLDLIDARKYCDSEIRETVNLMFGGSLKHFLNKFTTEGTNIPELGIEKHQYIALELMYLKNYDCSAAAKELNMSIDLFKINVIKELKRLKKLC